jgi:hypothetical protein
MLLYFVDVKMRPPVPRVSGGTLWRKQKRDKKRKKENEDGDETQTPCMGT